MLTKLVWFGDILKSLRMMKASQYAKFAYNRRLMSNIPKYQEATSTKNLILIRQTWENTWIYIIHKNLILYNNKKMKLKSRNKKIIRYPKLKIITNQY